MGSPNLIPVGTTLGDLRRAVQKLASLRLNADSPVTFASLTLSALTLTGFTGILKAVDGVVTSDSVHTNLADVDWSTVSDHDLRYYTETELGSNDNSFGASLIGIEDSMSLYNATNVETALEEVMDEITIITHLADSFEVGGDQVGTVTGIVENTQVINDGNELILNETTGGPSPNFVQTFEFSGIMAKHEPNLIELHWYYSPATTPHTISIQMYNYDTTTWDTIDNTTLVATGGSLVFSSFTITDGGGAIVDYTSGGAARVRFSHDDNGLVAHDFGIDYLAIKDDHGIGSGITDHGSLSGLLDDDHMQYLLVDGTRAMTGNTLTLGTGQAADITIEFINAGGTGKFHWDNIDSQFEFDSNIVMSQNLTVDGFVGVGVAPTRAIHVLGNDISSSSFFLRNTTANSFIVNQLQVGTTSFTDYYLFGPTYSGVSPTTNRFFRGSSLIDARGTGGLSLSSVGTDATAKIRMYTGGNNLRFTLDKDGVTSFITNAINFGSGAAADVVTQWVTAGGTGAFHYDNADQRFEFDKTVEITSGSLDVTQGGIFAGDDSGIIGNLTLGDGSASDFNMFFVSDTGTGTVKWSNSNVRLEISGDILFNDGVDISGGIDVSGISRLDGGIGIGVDPDADSLLSVLGDRAGAVTLRIKNANSGTTSHARVLAQNNATTTLSMRSHSTTSTITRFGQALTSAGEILCTNGNFVLGTFHTGYCLVLGTENIRAMRIDGTTQDIRFGLNDTDYTQINNIGNIIQAGSATADLNLVAKSVAIASLADGTDGELITWSAAGVIDVVAAGDSGQVLTSAGAGSAPAFQTTGYIQRDPLVTNPDWDLADHDGLPGPPDDTWVDLDFGPGGLGVVPVNTKAVVLALSLRHADTGKIVRFRPNGSTITMASELTASLKTQASAVILNGNVTIGCDTDGIIEYRVNAGVTKFTITVIGWFL